VGLTKISGGFLATNNVADAMVLTIPAPAIGATSVSQQQLTIANGGPSISQPYLGFVVGPASTDDSLQSGSPKSVDIFAYLCLEIAHSDRICSYAFFAASNAGKYCALANVNGQVESTTNFSLPT
jgi:hypothetical protein